MATKQGNVGLLDDPVAQRMLQSTVPPRFAYNWTDGTPRVVPIWFHWNGAEVVLSSPEDAPKFKSLQEGDAVAVTIDNDTIPCKVLLIRGTVHLDVVEGLPPEYKAAAVHVLGEAGGRILGAVATDLPALGACLHQTYLGGRHGFRGSFPKCHRTGNGAGRRPLMKTGTW